VANVKLRGRVLRYRTPSSWPWWTAGHLTVRLLPCGATMMMNIVITIVRLMASFVLLPPAVLLCILFSPVWLALKLIDWTTCGRECIGFLHEHCLCMTNRYTSRQHACFVSRRGLGELTHTSVVAE
jgi:hypothetical protein